MRLLPKWSVAWCGKRLAAVLAGLGVPIAFQCGRAVAAPSSCQRVVMEGELEAGGAWSAAIGQGWMFRVLPIARGQAGYSGWDLVVDREQPAGYPDALLLATMPYNSINEREIGTTYGLRAQDAIGWNPRSFRFMTDAADFREGAAALCCAGLGSEVSRIRRSMQSLLKLRERASWGELRIADAGLVPGTSDPAPFAQAWAMASARTPHQVLPASGPSSARGELRSMRFTLTLWLPGAWKLPALLHGVRAMCPQ